MDIVIGSYEAANAHAAGFGVRDDEGREGWPNAPDKNQEPPPVVIGIGGEEITMSRQHADILCTVLANDAHDYERQMIGDSSRMARVLYSLSNALGREVAKRRRRLR